MYKDFIHNNNNNTDEHVCINQIFDDESNQSNISLQIFISLFLIIGLLILFILFITRIHNLISTNQTKSSTRHSRGRCPQSLGVNDHLDLERSLFYIVNPRNDNSSLEMARIYGNSHLMVRSSTNNNYENNHQQTNRIQLNSLDSNQLFLIETITPHSIYNNNDAQRCQRSQLPSNHNAIKSSEIMFELPPPAYAEVVNVDLEQTIDSLPPPNYSQL